MTIDEEIRSNVIADVVDERVRQIEHENFHSGHDDDHEHGEMALAAACYALPPSSRHDDPVDDSPPAPWPISWDESWWKPKNRRRDLVRAAALIVAELERLDRATARIAVRRAHEEAASG